MTDHESCQEVAGNGDLKADLDGSLKQMQMRQSNKEHICLVKDVTLNINRAVSLFNKTLLR